MNSIANLFAFIITTILYYLKIKPVLTLERVSNIEAYKEYNKSVYLGLAAFFLIILLSQFLLNIAGITTKCGGNVKDNLGPAAIATFLPWIFMFGLVVAAIILFPGIKSAFSDVVGYLMISSSANEILNELLIQTEVKSILAEDKNHTEEKNALQNAAQVIMNIMTNPSLLINQIVPLNFTQYWETLTPLMKDKYTDANSPETKEMKEKLFSLVSTRDNVGEALWFIYTGLIVTSFVQLNINSKGCVTSPAQMEKNYQDFLDQEEQAEQDRKAKTSTTYTVD
tara:strand:- start:2180 stop:3025 length:846 start_codon:yes stop_codon:yes gene_type:complete